MRRYVFAGGTAVVTGAASGIGEAVAHALARRGSHLVLLDRDAERLSGVAAAIRDANPGLRVETHVVDLADRDTTMDVDRCGVARASADPVAGEQRRCGAGRAVRPSDPGGVRLGH